MDYRRSTAPHLIPADLAPGDAGAARLDWSGLRIASIRSSEHPLFRAAYERLWREFGMNGSMERKEVITARFDWDPSRPVEEHSLLYEMLVVQRGEEIVAVRDHSAVVPRVGADTGAAVVHLSHNLVEPTLRGSGLAGWLRAFPIQTARECAIRAGVTPGHVTLVAEMEQPRDGSAALRSYERAGFLKLAPAVVPYCQPDFRAADEIDRTSLRPVPYALVIRRLGRESERSVSGQEVRDLASALYTMFGVHVRADHMTPLWARLERFPPATKLIALQLPTQT